MKTTLIMKTLKNEDNLKTENNLKNWGDQKSNDNLRNEKEIIPGVQTGNGIPHDKYNIRTHMRAHTEKTTFDIFMQTQLNISWFE